MRHGHDSDVEIDDSRPQYPSDQVEVVEELVSGGRTVCRVRISDQGMLCKASDDGWKTPDMKREADCLLKISKNDLRSFHSPIASTSWLCEAPALRHCPRNTEGVGQV